MQKHIGRKKSSKEGVPASLAVSSIQNCEGSQKPLFMFMAPTT